MAQMGVRPDIPVDWPCSTFPDSPEGVALAVFFWIIGAEKKLDVTSGETPREYALNLFRQCLSMTRGEPRVTLDELMEGRVH